VSRSVREIQDWIVARVSALTGIAPEEIDAAEPLLRYGLDSVAVVALAADLETWSGYRFRENPLEAHPTIAALAEFLATQLAAESHPKEG
jgi:aryl carrier-like protein